MRFVLPVLCASFGPLACSSGGSDFSGSAKRTAAEQAECDAKAETIAELITPEVKNGEPDNYIEYKISVTNCDGEKIKLQAKHILFDVEAVSDEATSDEGLPFVATVGDTETSGVLEKVRGSDLFGNKGDKYFHNSTDKTLRLPDGTTELSFVIKLGGASHKPLEGEGTADNLLGTFLAFGDAKVVQKDVHFLGLFPKSKK